MPEKLASAPSAEGQAGLAARAQELGEKLKPDLEAAADPAAQEGASAALRSIEDKLAQGAQASEVGTAVPAVSSEEEKEAAKPRLAKAPRPKAHESVPARPAHLAGFAAELLPNPGDLYAQALAAAEVATQARWQGRRKLRFSGASASLPARDGWKIHFKFVAAENAASEAGAPVYVEVRRSEDARRGAYLAEAQAYPLDLKIEPGFVFPQGDGAPVFKEAALAPDSALDLARRALPALGNRASFGLRYRRLDSQKAPQLWYAFYDERGNAALVNAASGEARVLRRAKPRGPAPLPHPAGLYGRAYQRALDIAAARGLTHDNLYFAGAALAAGRYEWRFSFYVAPKSRTGKLEGSQAEEILVTPAVIEGAEREIKPEEEDALLSAAAVEERPLSAIPAGRTALAVWPATLQSHARNSPEEAWTLAVKALGRLPAPESIELILVEEPESGDTDLWYRFSDDRGPRVLVHANGSAVRDLRPMRERAPAERPFTWRNYVVGAGFFAMVALGVTAFAAFMRAPFLQAALAVDAVALIFGWMMNFNPFMVKGPDDGVTFDEFTRRVMMLGAVVAFGVSLALAPGWSLAVSGPVLAGLGAAGFLGAVGLWTFRGWVLPGDGTADERDSIEAAKEAPAVPGTAQRLARATQLANDLHHAPPEHNHGLLKELSGLVEQDPDADLHRLVMNAIISELYQLVPAEDRIRLVQALGSLLRRTPHAAIQREAIQEVFNEAFESGESAYAAVVAEEFSEVALASGDPEIRTLILSLLRRQLKVAGEAPVASIKGAIDRLESDPKPKE